MSTTNNVTEPSVLNFASVLLALGSANNNYKNNGDDDEHHSINAASEVSETSTNMSTSGETRHPSSKTKGRGLHVSQSSVMSMFHGNPPLCQASVASTTVESRSHRKYNNHHSGGAATMDTTSNLFHLAQQCESVSTSQGHTMDDQGSMAIYQGSGLPCNTQLAKTELQLLSALGRRAHSSESSPDQNNQIIKNHQRHRGNRKEFEMETDEDTEEKTTAAAASAAANRGKYKCSRCGAVKSNHHCSVMEQFTIADATQYERVVLTASEFNSTYVGKLSSSSSSALDTGAGSTGISIDLSGLSVANCLRMLPVRPNYVPVVPSHALKKPMRHHHSDPTTTTTTAVGNVDTSSNATATNNHNDNSTSQNHRENTVGSRGKGTGPFQFHTPQILSPDEYVVDETGRNSVTDMMHLNPGVLYLPIPTSFLLEGGGMQLAAMSLKTGEPIGVFSVTSTLVAGEGSGGAASSGSSSSSSQSFFVADNKQPILPQESPKYQHQIVFQSILVSSSASTSVRATTATTAVPSSSSPPSSSSGSQPVKNQYASTGTDLH